MLTLDRKKIEIIQARNGISLEELYTRSGLTSATVLNMRRGRPCKPTSVHKLAKALGVDVTEILKESEGTSDD
mgnify:CR=1 FL=1